MSDPVVLAVGDLVYKGPIPAYEPVYRQNIERVVAAMGAMPHDAIIVPGDISNDQGSLEQYGLVATILDPVKASMYPVPGNHDYETPGEGAAAAYFAYFGAQAGVTGKGWYSFDLANNWHLIALNGVAFSGMDPPVGIDGASEQGLWLAADLAANAGKHIIAYWHVPAVSPGIWGDARYWKSAGTFWQQLSAAGAEIIINGHDHIYARFGRQDWNGNGDSTGIREFIVGTGFSNHSLTNVPANLEKAAGQVAGWTSCLGFMKLTLGADRYQWEYIYVASANGGIPFTDYGASFLHGVTPPAGWLTAGNQAVYGTAGALTPAGDRYIGTQLAFAIRPPNTGLVSL